MFRILRWAAAAALTALPAGAGDVSGFTLPNGLDVVVIEDHRAPVVVQMVWYRAGAADEKPGLSGIAHYLEQPDVQGHRHDGAGGVFPHRPKTMAGRTTPSPRGISPAISSASPPTGWNW